MWLHVNQHACTYADMTSMAKIESWAWILIAGAYSVGAVRLGLKAAGPSEDKWLEGVDCWLLLRLKDKLTSSILHATAPHAQMPVCLVSGYMHTGLSGGPVSFHMLKPGQRNLT